MAADVADGQPTAETLAVRFGNSESASDLISAAISILTICLRQMPNYLNRPSSLRKPVISQGKVTRRNRKVVLQVVLQIDSSRECQRTSAGSCIRVTRAFFFPYLQEQMSLYLPAKDGGKLRYGLQKYTDRMYSWRKDWQIARLLLLQTHK